MREVKVWDLPTRIFHWTLFVLVTLAWFTGEDEGLAYMVHTLTGYVVLQLLLFRLIWGMIGNRHARFTSFVRGWRKVLRHGLQMLRLRPPVHLGHNPLAGWMVMALLAILLAIAATGLFAAAQVPGALLHGEVSRGTAKVAEGIHEILANILMLLVIFHVLGVLTDWLLTRDNIIRAMITGRKKIEDEGAEDARGGHWLMASVVALPLIYLLYMMIVATRF